MFKIFPLFWGLKRTLIEEYIRLIGFFIGAIRGEVQIWDSTQCRKMRTMSGHLGRVGTMAWNGFVLSTGSRDSAQALTLGHFFFIFHLTFVGFRGLY